MKNLFFLWAKMDDATAKPWSALRVRSPCRKAFKPTASSLQHTWRWALKAERSKVGTIGVKFAEFELFAFTDKLRSCKPRIWERKVIHDPDENDENGWCSSTKVTVKKTLKCEEYKYIETRITSFGAPCGQSKNYKLAISTTALKIYMDAT